MARGAMKGRPHMRVTRRCTGLALKQSFAVEVIRDPKTLTSHVFVGDRTVTTREGLLGFRDGQPSGYDGSK